MAFSTDFLSHLQKTISSRIVHYLDYDYLESYVMLQISPTKWYKLTYGRELDIYITGNDQSFSVELIDGAKTDIWILLWDAWIKSDRIYATWEIWAMYNGIEHSHSLL